MSEHQASTQSTAELFGSNRMWGLRELPLPEPVSWWPQTIGWYFLGAIILLGLMWLCLRSYRHYQANQYRREGLSCLERMRTDKQLLIKLPQLLRYCALQSAPRQNVASLTDSKWIAWLNESTNHELFSMSDHQLMAQLAYQPGNRQKLSEDRINQLIDASKKWMKSHRAAI